MRGSLSDDREHPSCPTVDCLSNLFIEDPGRRAMQRGCHICLEEPEPSVLRKLLAFENAVELVEGRSADAQSCNYRW